MGVFGGETWGLRMVMVRVEVKGKSEVGRKKNEKGERNNKL